MSIASPPCASIAARVASKILLPNTKVFAPTRMSSPKLPHSGAVRGSEGRSGVTWGVRLHSVARTTTAQSCFRTSRSTLWRRSCSVRLPPSSATNGRSPTNGSAASSRPAGPALAGSGIWTMSTSRSASPTRSVAALQRALSPTIPISRTPTSCSARSWSTRRALLATGASSRLSERRGQEAVTCSLDERIRPRVALIHEERTGSPSSDPAGVTELFLSRRDLRTTHRASTAA